MIERTEVQGRQATVAYLHDDMSPADKDDYDMVKIIFDDGEIRFAVPSKAATEPDNEE